MYKIDLVNRSDLSAIRNVNEKAIPAVNTVSESEFEWFYENALYFKKVIKKVELAGFLLVLPTGLNYDSLNYKWFSKRYTDFAYIDRIAIKENYKGNGVGTSLYLDLEKSISDNIKLIACEYNIKPLNETSQNFHRKLNYINVGTQLTENNTKEVSLMIKKLDKK